MTTSTSPNDQQDGAVLAPSRRGTGNQWTVLLVDDEPDVHEITRLVLAGASFSGVPVELHSAYSALEARAFLETHPDTALMLLDVVMETDDAGLRLIRYVREDIGNADLQIIVRTGQPGMAPEREVIPAYDVNGYFLKTELVAQKLLSIVISSLRAYKYIGTLRSLRESAPQPPRSAPGGYQRLALEEEFAKTVDTGAMLLLAQPQVHLASGTIAAIKLIPGWRRGDAILGPAEMVELIWNIELRQRFDEWLIRQGCAWAAAWRSAGLSQFRISLPILSENVWNRRLLAGVEKSMARDVALPPGTLDLEVRETALLTEHASAPDVAAAMRSIGVSVTLADFGLGSVSLSRLRRLLPDRVKIHHSFVHQVTHDRERAAIARSIVALAHTLEMTVIADGLALEQDLQFFKWEGCDVGQGDVLVRPMAVADVSYALLPDEARIASITNLH